MEEAKFTQAQKTHLSSGGDLMLLANPERTKKIKASNARTKNLSRVFATEKPARLNWCVKREDGV